MAPVGVLGESGAGAAMASGCGCGSGGDCGLTIGFATAFFGSAGAGRGGGIGVGCTMGAGGSTNCANTSAGTMSSAARISSPVCKAQISPTCRPTTTRAIQALRLIEGLGAAAGCTEATDIVAAFMVRLGGVARSHHRVINSGGFLGGGPGLSTNDPPARSDDQNQAQRDGDENNG